MASGIRQMRFLRSACIKEGPSPAEVKDLFAVANGLPVACVLRVGVSFAAMFPGDVCMSRSGALSSPKP